MLFLPDNLRFAHSSATIIIVPIRNSQLRDSVVDEVAISLTLHLPGGAYLAAT